MSLRCSGDSSAGFFGGSEIAQRAVLHVAVRLDVPGFPIAIRALGNAEDRRGLRLGDSQTLALSFELCGEAHSGEFLDASRS